jgi:hypothetical protein
MRLSFIVVAFGAIAFAAPTGKHGAFSVRPSLLTHLTLSLTERGIADGLGGLFGGKPPKASPAGGPPKPEWGAPAPAPEAGPAPGDDFVFEAPPAPPAEGKPEKPDILGMLLGGMLGKLKSGTEESKKHNRVFKSKKVAASKKHKKEY